MKTKRVLAVLLLLVMMLSLFTGCSDGKKKDDNTLTVIGRADYPIEEALKEKFPDINFEFVYYDGWNTTSNLMMQIKNQDIADIYTGTLPLSQKDAEENLVDLSGYGFCEKFEPSILNQYDLDGHVYQLPGSATIRCILYNKEMFAEHGWQEPHTFVELLALCRQIREETDDITPIVFGGAANGYYFTTMTTYSQAEYLYTVEGKEWEKEYLAGNASAEEGFGAGIQMVQELIDAGAFDNSKNFGLWDAAVFKERMLTGEAAMQFAWGAQNKLFALVEENPDKFQAIPFYNRAGDAIIGTGISYNIGLAKRLEEPGNEKKLENALRVMEWFSSEEGQIKMNIYSGSVIYPVKDAANEQTIPSLRKLWYGNLDGIKAPMLYNGYEDIIIQAADYIIEAIDGKHDLSGLAELIDEVHHSYLSENAEDGTAYVGTFAKDFTHEETVQIIAEMIHAKGGSDIALVTDGQRIGEVKNREGVHSKYYEGPLLYDWITVSVPGDYEKSRSAIMQMTLTGAQIQELLENGKTMVRYADDVNSSYPVANPEKEVLETATFPYYWAGMTVKMKDDKVASMTLADGTLIEQDKTYTVSFAVNDYMDTLATEGPPHELGYTAMDAITEYLQKNSPVNPVEVRP